MKHKKQCRGLRSVCGQRSKHSYSMLAMAIYCHEKICKRLLHVLDMADDLTGPVDFETVPVSTCCNFSIVTTFVAQQLSH